MKSRCLSFLAFGAALFGVLLLSGCVQQLGGPKTLQLQEGKWYKYKFKTPRSEKTARIDIFLTDENNKQWKEILGVRGVGAGTREKRKAVLVNFKVAHNLSLSLSYPFNLSEINKDREYHPVKTVAQKLSPQARLDIRTPLLALPLSLLKAETDLQPSKLFKDKSIRFQGGTMNLTGETETDFGKAYKMVWSLPEEGQVEITTGKTKPYPLIKLSARGVTEGNLSIDLKKTGKFETSDIKNLYSGYDLIVELVPRRKPLIGSRKGT